MQSTFLAYHNRIRAEAGVGPLVLHGALNITAQDTASYLAERVVLEHPDDASGVGAQRIFDALPGVVTGGENVGYASCGGQQLLDAWAASKGHYANIVNPEFDVVGFGYATGGDRGFGVVHFADVG
jgi:uncharacterized protein YkwD